MGSCAKSQHPRARCEGENTGQTSLNVAAPLIQRGEPGVPRGVGRAPALSVGRRERGSAAGGREAAREGEPRCADRGKGDTGGPVAALRTLPARSGSAGLRRDLGSKTGESFPKLWRGGPVPPQRTPHGAPPSAAVPAPAAGGGGRCSRLRAAFSRSPPAPRASSLLRASGSLRRSRRWGFFTSPTPTASSRLSRPKLRGGCGKGNASPTLFL